MIKELIVNAKTGETTSIERDLTAAELEEKASIEIEVAKKKKWDKFMEKELEEREKAFEEYNEEDIKKKR